MDSSCSVLSGNENQILAGTAILWWLNWTSPLRKLTRLQVMLAVIQELSGVARVSPNMRAGFSFQETQTNLPLIEPSKSCSVISPAFHQSQWTVPESMWHYTAGGVVSSGAYLETSHHLFTSPSSPLANSSLVSPLHPNY